MDIKVLGVDGNYGLEGVRAGTILFQFLPEEHDLALRILEAMHKASNHHEARTEIERLMRMISESSTHPDQAMMN